MTKESDIIHEAGDFWVLRNTKGYHVMQNVGTHSESDSSYSKDNDGLSNAVARCDYLARPKFHEVEN